MNISERTRHVLEDLELGNHDFIIAGTPLKGCTPSQTQITKKDMTYEWFKGLVWEELDNAMYTETGIKCIYKVFKKRIANTKYPLNEAQAKAKHVANEYKVRRVIADLYGESVEYQD